MRIEIIKDKKHPYSFFAECFSDDGDPRGFATLDQSKDFASRLWRTPKINWSCFGAVSVETAKEFTAGITALIELSKTLDERTGKP